MSDTSYSLDITRMLQGRRHNVVTILVYYDCIKLGKEGGGGEEGGGGREEMDTSKSIQGGIDTSKKVRGGRRKNGYKQKHSGGEKKGIQAKTFREKMDTSKNIQRKNGYKQKHSGGRKNGYKQEHSGGNGYKPNTFLKYTFSHMVAENNIQLHNTITKTCLMTREGLLDQMVPENF